MFISCFSHFLASNIRQNTQTLTSSIIVHGTPLETLHGKCHYNNIPIFVVLYFIVLFFIVLYFILLYCIVFYCLLLYYIVFYCIVLYYIVFIVLYCILLYYFILYCILLYCVSRLTIQQPIHIYLFIE